MMNLKITDRLLTKSIKWEDARITTLDNTNTTKNTENN